MSCFYESTADGYFAPIDSLPMWETVEHEQDLTLSSQQQQPSEEQPSNHLSPSIFQYVDLGDKPLEHERDDASNSKTAHSTAQQVTEASKAIRSARSKSQFVQSANPYRHPRSAVPDLSSSGTGTGIRNAPRPLRFVHHNLIPPARLSSTLFSEGATTSTSVTPSAIHSPVMSSPGLVDGTPLAQSQLQQFPSLHAPPPQNSSISLSQSMSDSLRTKRHKKKYLIRADTHFEPHTGIYLIVLELPGVDKKDMKISLVTARHNRIRYLKVWGILESPLPVPTAEVLSLYPELFKRERKFGEFSRTFVVPSDLNHEHVRAEMNNGLLTLRIQLGLPADVQEDVQEILIN